MACGPDGPSVWYSATAARDGRVAVRVQAGGDLDLSVEVFRRVRSRLDTVDCDVSDGHGEAALSFVAEQGGRYLVRISQAAESVPGTFALHVSAPFVQAQPPGTLLPAGGATRTLDRAEHVDDAWSVVLHSGTTYRLRLSGRNDSCRPTAEIYAPGTTSFSDGAPVHSVPCGSSLTFTPRPGEGGRYPIRVAASETARRPQTYHLQVATAHEDDTAPGLPFHNHRRVAGGLRGDGIDAVDLYRFVVADRGRTLLALSTAAEFTITLVSDGGRRLGRDSQSVERTLGPGTYFVAVRALGSAVGRYRLRRDSRVLTHTRLSAVVSGRSATLTTAVSPVTSGPVRIVVERFDPLVGWLFADQFDLRVAGGRGGARFSGRQGRYHAQAEFRGTRDAATSMSRSVQFRLRAA